MDPYKFSKYFSFGRSIGQNQGFGFEDGFFNRMYRQFQPRSERILSASGTGDISLGVFNLEFSPDGRFLVAACADKSIRILDNGREKCVFACRDAHTDCVNCIQFLDSRMFATGSDDKTIGLWDIRMMKEKVGSLVGHDAWIKSLAYMPESRVLLSSALDGDVLAWEMNNPDSEGHVQPRDVVQLNGLMRLALTPDCSKLIVSNSCGYLMVFHDLDIWKMRKQYTGIKPNLYRLMQVSGIALPAPIRYGPLFSAKRNRLELIADFPSGSSACVISTLIVHPDGKRCISRHVTNSENEEFTCVHDIAGPRVCGKTAPEAEDSDDTEDEEDHPVDGRNQNGSADSRPAGSSSDEEEANSGENRPPRRKRRRVTPRRRRTPAMPAITGLASLFRPSLRLRARSSAGIDLPGPSSSSANASEEGMEDFLTLLRRARTNFVPHAEFVERGEDLPMLSSVPSLLHPRIIEPQRQRQPRSTDVMRAIGEQIAAREDIYEGVRLAAGRPTENSSGSAPFQIHVVSMDTWEALNTIRETRLRETASVLSNAASPTRTPADDSRWCLYSPSNRHLMKLHREGKCKCEQVAMETGPPDPKKKHTSEDIFPNVPRMTHYIEEANVQHGYIKEISMSPDGRVIASPYGTGHRLLMFDSECREPQGHKSFDYLDDPKLKSARDHKTGAVELVEASTSFSHSSPVLCTRFAPFHSSLVTGSLSGEVVWHYPLI